MLFSVRLLGTYAYACLLQLLYICMLCTCCVLFAAHVQCSVHSLADQQQQHMYMCAQQVRTQHTCTQRSTQRYSTVRQQYGSYSASSACAIATACCKCLSKHLLPMCTCCCMFTSYMESEIAPSAIPAAVAPDAPVGVELPLCCTCSALLLC